LVDRPELPGDLAFVLAAFWRLHTERPLGFGGAGPIPHFAALAYADRLAMGPDEADWFCDMIVALDGEYLKWVESQRPEPEKQRDGR
jgi:hypothetical protein